MQRYVFSFLFVAVIYLMERSSSVSPFWVTTVSNLIFAAGVFCMGLALFIGAVRKRRCDG